MRMLLALNQGGHTGERVLSRTMAKGLPNLAKPELQRRGLPGAVYDSVADLGAVVVRWVAIVGDVTVFALKTVSWLMTRLPRRDTLQPSFYNIGVLTVPLVA